MKVLQKIRESLALILVALLPFHALLVTVLTKLMTGPGHAPLSGIAIWKEGLLGVILALALVEILRSLRKNQKPKTRNQKPMDLIDGLILALIALSILVSGMSGTSLGLFALGFKYDFLAPFAFLILRRVPWSATFFPRVITVLLIDAVLLSLYGFLTLVAPQSFFTALGYSDLHSLYVPGGPLAPYQQIGGAGIRRMQSAMSGPNQLGVWLLIPWAIAVSSITKNQKPKTRNQMMFMATLVAIALLLTFSRSAWIGAFVIALLAAAQAVPKHVRMWLLASGAGIATILVLALTLLVPSVFLRIASSTDHLTRPMEAVSRMVAHPFGQGLGAAGPASNRVSDACVFLDDGADASWAKDRPSLCVFVGDTQVQPVDRSCSCPFLPENWYLQIGVELGFLGFLLYVGLVVVILRKLSSGIENGKLKMENSAGILRGELLPKFSILNFQFSIFLAFLGISIAALFLHAWEDAAAAWTVWMLMAITCSDRP